MVRGDKVKILQVKGIWVEEGGQLLPFEPIFSGGGVLHGQQTTQYTATAPLQRKMLEIITNLPGSVAGRDRRKTTESTRDILGGVTGWEYLLGEMFGADHVTIGMDSMCLIQDCIGGRGRPVGLADVFFQRSTALLPKMVQWLTLNAC